MKRSTRFPIISSVLLPLIMATGLFAFRGDDSLKLIKAVENGMHFGEIQGSVWKSQDGSSELKILFQSYNDYEIAKVEFMPKLLTQYPPQDGKLSPDGISALNLFLRDELPSLRPNRGFFVGRLVRRGFEPITFAGTRDSRGFKAFDFAFSKRALSDESEKPSVSKLDLPMLDGKTVAFELLSWGPEMAKLVWSTQRNDTLNDVSIWSGNHDGNQYIHSEDGQTDVKAKTPGEVQIAFWKLGSETLALYNLSNSFESRGGFLSGCTQMESLNVGFLAKKLDEKMEFEGYQVDDTGFVRVQRKFSMDELLSNAEIKMDIFLKRLRGKKPIVGHIGMTAKP